VPPRNLLLVGLAASLTAAAALWYFRDTPRVDARTNQAAQPRLSISGKNEPDRAGSSARSSRQSEATRAPWRALPLGFERNQRIEREGFEVASHDLRGVWERLEALSDPAERALFLRGMFFAIAAGEPRDAVAAIKKVANGDERALAMQTVANAWRGGVPAGTSINRRQPVPLSNAAQMGMSLLDGTPARAELALLWADELLSDPAERVALLGAAAAAFTLKNPERVTAIASAIHDDGSKEIFRYQFAEALRSVAGETAWSNLHALPADDLRKIAERSILNAWAQSDPRDAAAAIANLPPGDERTRAINIVAESWALHDTAAAFAWASTMETEERASAEEAIRHSAPIGIGAALDVSDDGYPVIRELLPGGAAERSALIPQGSKILSVVEPDGQTVNLHGMELGRIAGKLRGARGTPVTMLVQSPGNDQPRTVTVVREQIIHKTARE
jgi:hypothetical protein